jgi:hypothetical protein
VSRYKCSDKKQKLIDEYTNKPVAVGDSLYVKRSAVSSYASDGDKDKTYNVDVVKADPLKVKHEGNTYIIKLEDIIKRNTIEVGSNRFIKDDYVVRPVQFCLESILNIVHGDSHKPYHVESTVVGEMNWDPYVYDGNGAKTRYQRGFVWTEDDNRLLLNSIYNGVDCGKVLMRRREFGELQSMYNKGERELFFSDIVDGKQRLNAVVRFMNDEYQDSYGDYFSDLSDRAQSTFLNGFPFSYSEIRNATDSQVVRQFLKMNHLGVPQSKEHIEFVSNLNNGYAR